MKVGGTLSVMLTKNEHVLLNPALSRAVQVTMFAPSRNVAGDCDEGAGEHDTLARPDSSVATGELGYAATTTAVFMKLFGLS